MKKKVIFRFMENIFKIRLFIILKIYSATRNKNRNTEKKNLQIQVFNNVLKEFPTLKTVVSLKQFLSYQKWD